MTMETLLTHPSTHFHYLCEIFVIVQGINTRKIKVNLNRENTQGGRGGELEFKKFFFKHNKFKHKKHKYK